MKQRASMRRAAVDLLLLALAFTAATQLRFRNWPWEQAPNRGPLLEMLAITIVGSVVASVLVGAAAATAPPRPSYSRALLTMMTAFAVVATQIVVLRPYFSRPHLATVTALWVLLVFGARWLERQRPWTERLRIITATPSLVADLAGAPHVVVHDVIDPRSTVPAPGPPPYGTVLAVDLSMSWSEQVTRYVSATSISGQTVRPFSDVYEEHTGRMPLSHLSEGWEIERSLQRKLPFLPAKQAIDIVLVVLTMPLWLPLMGAAALAVLLADGRPVIFRQVRVGHRGRPVTLYKLRTMSADAEAQGAQQATEHDPRITPLGRILRMFRIDEVPQLVNVLRGQLAIVGPRPEQVAFVERYAQAIPFYEQRHLVRPGITGWAQVNCGYAASQEQTIEKLSYDFYYLKHMSPLLDLEILARSIWTVVSGDTGTKGSRQVDPTRAA